ncbi:leucyl aminopeptidase [uncultured Ferrovibrio sp.]|jgi:leucyl aminopeptidase|uniref:leucyl aminopeptidase n=1 Tax=uncultured Ferrovibrio sp. TaxID=1576913 RepID=UPI00260E9E79|nr:leucyl aminopeptidase [uncultured Ferrovibrio sp.]
MKIAIVEAKTPKKGSVVLSVAEGRQLGPLGQQIDKAVGGALTRAMTAAARFSGAKGQWLEVLAPGGGLKRVLLAGLGKPVDVKATAFEALGGEAVRRLMTSGETELAIVAEVPKGAVLPAAEAAARAALGARLGGYRFDKYRTTLKDKEKPSLSSVAVLTGAAAAARKLYQPLDKLADGVVLTRNLVTEPANVIYPESLAAECRKLAKLGVKVEVLGEREMKKLGMGALLGVGQGSERESQLVVMQWNGGKKGTKPVALVGKGVCFDTGGISIKPSAGMEEMKWDMGGAGAVIGAMAAIAGRKAKANVVGVVALVENMPDGKAQRPGDVVKSMSGQTIEVLNTDAEGRLILCDAMWYAQERFKPQAMVDLATLTGAIIISLGHEHAGLFSNDDKLAERLTAAGKAEDELLWRMPLSDAYDEGLKSQIADMQNIAGPGFGAGSITAAQFLQRFVKDRTPWAHLDIAGTAWSKKDKATVPKGATGFGVRLLNRLIADHYEER